MEIYHFVEGQPPVRCESIERMPDAGFVWIDFEREDSAGWEQYPQRLLGIEIDAEHVSDSQNATHPSSFDCTDGYDVLVMEGLGPKSAPLPLETRVGAFFVFDRLLVTVHAPDSLSFAASKQRLLSGRGRAPPSVLRLAHFLLDTLIDRFLALREPLGCEFTRLQDELLGGRTDANGWHRLLDGRREVRRLEALCEAQLEALDAWRLGTSFEWHTGERVRMRDLCEHVTRLLNHAGGLGRDLEAAVQLHFAATANRSNEIMQVFTVMSVVFMPLSLLTGIWGMNFEDMPELHWRYGYPVALGLIALLGATMLLWFRRRKFF